MHPFFRGPVCNEAFTITFGDQAENHKGMQIIGKLATKGMSITQLEACQVKLTALGIKCKLIDLGTLLPGTAVSQAAVLVITGGINAFVNDGEKMIYKELRSMPKDTTYRTQDGNVLPKSARHNNTMADFHQEPDILNGKGTIVNFKDYPKTSELRDAIADLISVPSLVGELNHYYDADKCSINYHGDAERRIVVGARFGYGANDFPLKFQWYKSGKPIGCEGKIALNAGDVYIMSEKTVGHDTYKEWWAPTLRHSAGRDRGLKRKYDRVSLL